MSRSLTTQSLSRSSEHILLAALAVGSLLGTAPAPAQTPIECPDNPLLSGSQPVFRVEMPGEITVPTECTSAAIYCEKPRDGAPSLRTVDPFCDPKFATCSLELRVPFALPGKEQNSRPPIGIPGSVLVYWYGSPIANTGCSPPNHCGEINLCGLPGLDGFIAADRIETYLLVPGVSCASLASPALHGYSLAAYSCYSDTTCRKVAYVPQIDLSARAVARAFGCLPLRHNGCSGGDQSCPTCPAPGTSVGGDGPTFDAAQHGVDAGPNASLRYAAGGVGGLGQPGSAAISPALGTGWMHDYAERIVPYPNLAHVAMATRFATFREFWDDDADGIYDRAAPSDEYRQLTYNAASGWTLRDLNGTVTAFDLSGRWLSETDKNGNATVGMYNTAGQLTTVTKPDGRSETFAYAANGKLASITEIGVGGSPLRAWLYTWLGPVLTQIDRPDGTKLQFLYGDTRFPGYLTAVNLQAAGSTTIRKLQRWSFDSTGNVIRTWKGDDSFTGTAATEKWQLAFDDPANPAVTTVTDPLGVVATYQLGRDPGSGKPRLAQLSGDCPACGTGPNTQLFYEDAAHPLRPTREIDGEGHVTLMEYDPHGMMTSRTEAFGEPEARTTEWQYDANFPAFPTLVRRPSTVASELRETSMAYDAATGDLLSRTETGMEAGSAFALTTSWTYNSAGQPLTVDPPGYGAADVVSFTYDPTRGSLLPLSRTDPLIGTTSFGYDGLNRRSSVTDPNGVETTTLYDSLSRVKEVLEVGDATTPEQRTSYTYSSFGDLICIKKPEGNGVAFGYDAVGRQTEVQRGTAVATPTPTTCLQTATSTPRDRMLYTLNAAGMRINEKLQTVVGSTITTQAETSYAFSTRCHLDKVIQAPGTAAEAITEHGYDCNSRLARTWDANHPSSGQTLPATSVFGYDALDRLVSVNQPWGGAGGGNAVTSYAFDVQDHLVQVTDAEGNPTTYSYSDRDLMTQEVSPASGTTSRAYNEHSELVSETDARGITATRTLDALDRVTRLDYPGTAQDVTYTYDDSAVPFSKGRLTRISRTGSTLDYRYDRFGRTTQDGALGYSWDRNGRRTGIVYPQGVTAAYTFDFADREKSLTVTPSGSPAQTVVSATGATYKGFGPLATLPLGNGTTETRNFDARYSPTEIKLTAGATNRLDWLYGTDKVGNPLSITDSLAAANNRTFTYQDVQYFLASAAGPWPGALSWTFDKMGNRLSETRSGVTDAYTYGSNTASGHSPILQQIALGAGGTRTYTFGPAGHLAEINAASNRVTVTHDEAGQLGQFSRLTGTVHSDFLYDGRGFLAHGEAHTPATALEPALAPRGAPGTPIFADGFESGDVCAWAANFGTITPPPNCPPATPAPFVNPTYSSAGLLYSLTRDNAPSEILYFPFAGRPVAQLTIDGDNETYQWLTTDHLGTPIALTNNTGALLWQGGFEPYGKDYSGAEVQNLFLRLPGQWEEETWSEAGLGVGAFYNVHRWYESGAGRYGEVDPVYTFGFSAPFRYALTNPVRFRDASGLQALPAPAPLPPPTSPMGPTLRLVPPPSCAPPTAPSPWFGLLGRLGGALTVLFDAIFDPPPLGEPGVDDFTDPNCKPRCGDCDPTEHFILQSAVNQACKLLSTKCEPGMSTEELELKLFQNIQCRLARKEVNERCFRGGDEGHRKAEDNAFKAGRKCAELLTRPR